MQSLNLSLPISAYKTQNLQEHKTLFPFPNTRITQLQSQPLHSRFAPLLATKTDIAIKQDEKKSVTNDDIQVDEQLPAGLQRELMPKHVAVIMDGNGRWAKQQGGYASMGHEAGGKALMNMVELCCKWGIKVLTVFAFSCDNWTRPQLEVDFLMRLFERVLKTEVDNYARKGIRISIIGDSSRLSESLQKLIDEVEETTKNNSKLHLLVAVSYSGKYDVVKACKSIATQVRNGLIEPEDINESLIEQELETNCSEFPSPDLLIRTSGELRISNFLLWQLAYTELFFAEELWPDFGEDGFIEALTSYQQRQRRYGGRNS